ncbi:MAG: RecX family transcriptional regulator [Oscillospiraceae bacterium]
MAILSKITVTKLMRYALFFDDEFTFSIDEKTLAENHLKVGISLNEEQINQLKEQSNYEYAKQKALSLLGYKDYTKNMLVKRLQTYEIDAQSATDAAYRMEELGLINEQDYAMRLSRDLVRLKKYSCYKVTQELKTRGLDEEIIQIAIEQFTEDSFPKRIAEVIQKKYLRDLDTPKGKNRAINGLVRLGYRPSEVVVVINNLLEDPEYYLTEED